MQLYGWHTVRPVLHNFLPNRLFIYLVIHAFYTQDEGKTMKSLNKGTLWLSTLQTSKKYRITMCFFRSMKGADSVDFNRSYVYMCTCVHQKCIFNLQSFAENFTSLIF